MTKDRDMPPFETDPSSMDMDMTMSPEPSMTSLSGMDMDMDTDDGDNGDDEVNNQDNGSLIPYDSVLSQSARPGSCAASLSATSALACTRFTHVGDMETLFGSVSVRVRQANNMFEVRFNSPGDDTSITLAVVRLGDASSKTVRESSMMRKAVTLKIDPTQIDGMCCSVDGSGKRIDVSVAVVVAQRGEHSSGKMETMRFKSGMGRFRLNVACVNACGSWSNSGFGSSMVDLIGGLTGSNGQEGMQEQQSGEVMLTQQGCPVCVG